MPSVIAMAIAMMDALIEYWSEQGACVKGRVGSLKGGWRAPHLGPAPVRKAVVQLPVNVNEAP